MLMMSSWLHFSFLLQALAVLEKERADLTSGQDGPSRERADAKKPEDAGALSPHLAVRVSCLLLPSAIILLEALVASSRLGEAMEPQQGVVCQCMRQAVAQVQVT